MIPHRIKLTGFLSYKEEQELAFGEAPLWMLAGINGSGKSSIFDGVTYALFGHHRGGSQNASELINKESSALAVEFDFKLDGELHRVKRTLRRSAKGSAAGTQQVFRHAGAGVGTEGGWEAVRDTNKKVDFDAWVHDKIGLDYETFTSSVLLLQGKAEKLLDARPSGRAEVLAGIVDLERYQRLHERANARKLEYKAKFEALSHQANAVPDVSDLEYATALMKIDEAEEAKAAAGSALDAVADLEAHARRWADTQARLGAARGRLAQAEAVLTDAVRIEREFARLNELRSVLPAAQTVVSVRGQFAESQRKTDKYLRDREAAQERKTQADHAQKQAKDKRATLLKQLADDENKLARANARLRELGGVLEKVRLAEDQDAELKRLADDFARLPADADGAVRAAAAEADRLAELNRVLPILERFGTERFELAAAAKGERAALDAEAKQRAEGIGKKAAFDKLEADAERARAARAAADEAAAASKALARAAADAAAEFSTLAGARLCKACGQPLTEAHYAAEKRKRDKEAKAAAEKHRAAAEAQTAAARREGEVAAQVEAARKELADLREAFQEARGHARQLAADIKRLTDSLGLRYAEMPDPYKTRIAPAPVADWTATAFPERDELVGLRREAGGLDGAKRRLRDAQAVQQKAVTLRAQLDSAKATLGKLKAGLPDADPGKLREEHRGLQAEESTLLKDIKGAKLAAAGFETEADKLGREAHAAVQTLTDLTGKLNTEEVTRRHCTDAADRAKRDLPPAWATRVDAAGMAEYQQWAGEKDALTAAGTDAKAKQLEQARGGLATLRDEITTLAADAGHFPADVRKTPDEAKALVLAARKALDARDQELRDARHQQAVLDGYRAQRGQLGGRRNRAEADHNKYKLLAELLGRDRLQRHLVRQAERQIVDHANAVLDRLSGGQLFLKLVGGDDGAGADRALDLECANRVTGGAPINVAFLSGSQRFRVAVSLALAIGQYASKQHRPIESVIIDEGFGCLDRQGRQVMIQELQNLRGHLHCILLVSHQEEFADAFPDGYRFALEDGATKVSRFVR